ncbi:putative sulfatase [Chitinophaga skermanii]|uniref:Putative sulfatase n=1 Tax=Chitinophaga skermanii TaxID=331697 RepID=A0A327Q1H3_9BACT|nr:alkaline phosphatase family protein [Chitinophaga skermanii]RAI97571.1 putative sulfatase [Chitinophaga skermanii]
MGKSLLTKPNQWIPAFNRFLLFSIGFLSLIILLHWIDLLSIQWSGKAKIDWVQVLPVALWEDILTFFSITRWIVLPFVLLYLLVNRVVADILFILTIAIYAIAAFVLDIYFHQTTVPLGADLYGYSSKEIEQTVGAAAGGFSKATVFQGIAVFLVTVGMLVLLYRKKIGGDRRGFWFGLICSFMLLVSFVQPLTHSFLGSEFESNVALNKAGFFIAKTQNYFFPAPPDNSLLAGEGDNGDDRDFVDPKQYPFLHTNTGEENVLTTFMPAQGQPLPNVVIIVIEGLGRAFSGKDAYLGSFTPFIDSLGEKSLYWENFLSGGGRTFAMLPTITGSLPFAKNGFNEMAPNFPKAISLWSLAKFNGYQTRFLYAGDADFDQMDAYARSQGISEIIDKSKFGQGYEMLPANSGGFTWGYSDKSLFQKYLDATPTTGAPRIDVMLTVSTHSPFKIPHQAYYDKLTADKFAALGLKGDELAAHQEYKNVYASVLYMDDAVRYFFQEYAKRPDYNNTIFLITGDHRLPEIPMRSKIDRYHTLLVMHSPLLQRTAKFSSISSHFDITPSLTSYLKSHGNFQAPNLSTWIGTGLDTTREFSNRHQYPLMQTKNDLVDFISGTWMLNQDQVYRVLPNMDLERMDDQEKLHRLQSSFQEFLRKNKLFYAAKTLVPDSLVNKYTK